MCDVGVCVCGDKMAKGAGARPSPTGTLQSSENVPQSAEGGGGGRQALGRETRPKHALGGPSGPS